MWHHNFIIGSLLLGLAIGVAISTLILLADWNWREPRAWWWWGFRILLITNVFLALCLGINLMVRFHGAT